jgi:hypothetical protein
MPHTCPVCAFTTYAGTYFECIYDLMTFGIPKGFLPFKIATGELDLRAHHQWIATLKVREATMDASRRAIDLTHSEKQHDTTTRTTSTNGTSTATMNPPPSPVFNEEIMVPGPMDIIMGRGPQPKSSVGYFRFRSVLEEHFHEYDTAEREDKMGIAGTVLERLKGMGCRFVRRSLEGLLEECKDSESLDKICHTFRNIRWARTQKGKQSAKQQVEGISTSFSADSQGVKRWFGA